METCRHVGTHGTVMKCTKSLIVIIVVVRIVRIVFILAPVSRSRITYNVHGVLASLLPYTALHSTALHSTAQHSPDIRRGRDRPADIRRKYSI